LDVVEDIGAGLGAQALRLIAVTARVMMAMSLMY
jgi:hypothetical protein